ncbi:ATP-dependent DNA helicase [Shewanella gelidii]|uniref:DNA 5'-3' helicase n=1 Tax=Shewanella gelidii TaxID=1642821 RepID=A0A917JX81_9GAMM|nr:ATP-dependent DNA helicase [Shewanella gelidii]MCL1098636.1 ATP-dependent DNA helicase [Shewanella gelidii]GGI86431.1 helicase [Shewanella gelidii]
MATRLEQQVAATFTENGPLAKHVKGFRLRQVQLDMAQSISQSIAHKSNVIVEAGTGVGKTFAYLIPALLSGKQVIVSTGSKNLQEQLFFKDLPELTQMLNVSPQLALLKGRSNYLCQYRLVEQMTAASTVDERTLDDLLRIHQWAGISKDGDFGGLSSVAEDAFAIGLVASSKETCIGQKCDYYEDCFTRKARMRALEARIIVVNHHLFFADRVLKETGFAELLPDADVVIFDEAHLLPDIALTYFGQQCSTKAVVRLLEQIIEIYQSSLKDTGQIESFSLRCLQQLRDWHNLLFETGNSDWRRLIGMKSIAFASWALLDELKLLQRLLQAHVGRSDELDLSLERLVEFIDKLSVFFHCDNPQVAYSVDYASHTVLLRISPMNVAKECAALFDQQTSWVFTSATLQVQRSLGLFAADMAMSDAKQLIMDSPFDYQAQSLLCVPRQLGHVSNQQMAAKQLVTVCQQAIRAAQGRTFILFTSHRMLQLVATELNQRSEFPLLVQGQDSKQGLLKKFRQLGNAVLLGTGSFWEGVDVRGNLLSCVIIDKLPFISPEDPLYRARAESAQQKQLDPFETVSLPQAIISLKQGVGRLIRDEKDKGVLILCDNRIVNRPYGAAFLESLPPMSRTRDLQKALSLLQDC